MLLSAALDEYLYSKDLTPSARRWYGQKLTAFVDWCAAAQDVTQVGDVTAALVHRYVASLRERESVQYGRPLSSYTLKGYVRVIKCWLAWCARDDLLPEKVARRIELPKVDQKVIKTFSPEHIRALFAACDDPTSPQRTARDRAILGVLLDTGIRANELCDLTLDRAVLTADDAYLLVNGKGRKQREVGLGKKARLLLHRYIHRERHAAPDERHVFVTQHGTPLRPEGLDRMLYRLRDKAGISGVRVSAHIFRHTMACSYLRAGGDVYKLSRLLGHTSVQITEGYLRDFQARNARQGPSVLDAWGK